MAKYFFDTEFIESGPDRPVTLISIGMVTEDEDGNIREYYAVSSEFDPNDADDWVKENVLKDLKVPKDGTKTREEIKNDILEFIGDDKDPQFWADHCSYDWVVFAQLFGRMVDLPDHFPKYCHDIKVEEMRVGDPPMPEQKGTVHDALDDARYLMTKYQFLKKYYFTKNRLNLKELRETISSQRIGDSKSYRYSGSKRSKEISQW